jgi:hypothetical protein
MSDRKFWAGLALCVGIFVLAAQARPGDGKTPAKAVPTLSALDYIQIQQLVASYPFALDTGADHGYMYADLFAPDGSFGKAKGREALAALAYQHRPGQGPNYTRQFVSNLVILPSVEGATGKAYVTVMEFGDGKKPPVIEMGGHYEDIFVRTPAGWRFKTRTFIRSQPGSATETAQAPARRAHEP